MFVIRWLGVLLSLPLQWAGQLVMFFHPPTAAVLLQGAWALGGDSAIAIAVLGRMLKAGQKDAARVRAEQYIRRRPHADLAVFAGLMAIDDGDLARAGQWLAYSKTLGPSRTGMPDILEYSIAEHEDDPRAATNMGQALIATRRDLPLLLTRRIHNDFLLMDLLDHRFDQIRPRAEHMLAVEENPVVEFALWALARKEGRESQAAAHFARANCPPAASLHYRALGAHAIGDVALRDRMLSELEQADAALAQRTRQFLAKLEVTT
jgi:hypothetical protein